MGPVLSFVEATEGEWRLSALVVAQRKPGELRWRKDARGGEARASALWTVGHRTAWRFAFSVSLEGEPSAFTYELRGEAYEVHLPARGAAPRVAYASCNGFSSAKEKLRVADKYVMWRRMKARHDAAPYHLLMLGGDQVYADEMLETVPEMVQWTNLSYEEENRAQASPEMISALRTFYFDLYSTRWAVPNVAAMLARVPMAAMWDDHDLIDGWGSYPPERQDSDVFQSAIGPAATKAFRTFQQQLGDDEAHAGAIAGPTNFTRGHVIGPVAFVLLDMRTERTHTRVMTREHWDDVYRWLEGLQGVRHLMVVASVPVVYPSFPFAEQIIGLLPLGLEDDLRDQWASPAHQGERLRLVHRLLDLAGRKGVRPTIVSGDVHLAALGMIEAENESGGHTVINQLISSSIVHPPPRWYELLAMRPFFGRTEQLDEKITARMVELPGTHELFVARRNFLSLEPDETGDRCRVWVKWYTEGIDQPYTRVLHTCGPG